MILTVALVASVVLLAYANGANDNGKPVASAFGCGALSLRGAVALATVAQLLGSVASIFVAGGLLAAFRGKWLVPDALAADPGFLVAVALGAASAVLLATRVGLPVSTTHALVGALVGAGVASPPAAVEWHALGGTFFLPLVASPLLSMLIAAVAYPSARAARLRFGVETDTCVCVMPSPLLPRVTADGAVTLARAPLAIIADQATCASTGIDDLGVTARRAVDVAQIAASAALAFARGLNDTPKILALLVVVDVAGMPANGAVVVVAAAMALGGVLHAKRLLVTLGQRVTDINHGQGLVVSAIASALVIGASALSLPVSTTHVTSGAIFGIGIWNRRIAWRLVGGIVLAWVGTLPLAAASAALVATALGQ